MRIPLPVRWDYSLLDINPVFPGLGDQKNFKTFIIIIKISITIIVSTIAFITFRIFVTIIKFSVSS